MLHLYKILCKFVYLGHRIFALRYKDELSINEYTSANIPKNNYLIHWNKKKARTKRLKHSWYKQDSYGSLCVHAFILCGLVTLSMPCIQGTHWEILSLLHGVWWRGTVKYPGLVSRNTKGLCPMPCADLNFTPMPRAGVCDTLYVGNMESDDIPEIP